MKCSERNISQFILVFMEPPSALFWPFSKKTCSELVYYIRNFSNFHETELSYIFLQKSFLYLERNIFKTLAYLEVEAYSEPWCIQDPKHIQSTVKHLQWKRFAK